MTPWTVAYQALLSMEFSRQEFWNGLPFLSPKVMISKQINKETNIAITMESRGGKSANDDFKPTGHIVVNGVRSSSLRKDKNLPEAGG